MSELALRDLPPVEPVDPPSRLSMTLLRLYNNCNRSAYLYRKYRGGPPSHALNRGTVAHVGFERMLEHMVENGESRLPMDVAKDIMQEAVNQTPITVPSEEQAKLRVMAAHFAEGVELEPESIRGVEQKIVLPIDDLLVVGKLDVVLSPAENVLEIWDWKSAMGMSAMDEIAEKLRDGRLAPKSFQLLVYVLLAAFGIPVESHPCPTCDGTGKVSAEGEPRDPITELIWKKDGRPKIDCKACDGRGGEDVPLSDEPLGKGVDLFRAFEQYPMFLFDSQGGGKELGKRGPLDVTRPELIDHRLMLEGLVYKAAAAFGLVDIPGIESWRFEAVPGSHCKQCPARAECPLPEHLRTWAGEINEPEQLSEAVALLELEKAHHRARQKEARLFVKAHGPHLVGGDMIATIEAQTSWQTDWGALEDGVERSATFGEPFDLEAHRKRQVSERFVVRKATPEELEELSGPREEPMSLSERFGDDPPF